MSVACALQSFPGGVDFGHSPGIGWDLICRHGRQPTSACGWHPVISTIKFASPGWRWADLSQLLVLAWAVVFTTVRARAAGAEYLIDVWTGENGLPNSSVTAITQTPDGYLWVGTYNGLARFDGTRFVTFDPANVPALAHARVRKLSVDNQGTLYINTYDGSLTSFKHGGFAREWTGREEKDPDASLVSSAGGEISFLLHQGILRRRAQNAPAGAGWEDVAPTNRVVGALCLADARGNLWYRASDQLLWRLDGSQLDLPAADAGLGGRPVGCLASDAAGHLWAGTDQGIAVLRGGQFDTVTPTNGEPVREVTVLSVNDDGSYWAVVNGRVLKASGRRWVREAAALSNYFTGTLTQMGAQPDHHGGVWFYEYQRGLIHVDANGGVRHFDDELGFPGSRINCFFEDREGDWWAGLDAGGLVRLRERRFQTMVADSELPKPAKSVCEDADGAIWIATLGNGVESWALDGSHASLSIPDEPGGGFAFSVYPDADGRLWVSAGQENLFLLSSDGLKRVRPSVHGVKTILVDHAGRIWAGTKNGLFMAAPDAPTSFNLNLGIGRRDVRALADDPQGNLWVGTESGTLYRLTNEVVAVYHPAGDESPSQAILSLLADADGTIWAGTFRGGLLRFQNGRFVRFAKPEGLPDSVISQILDDGSGNLWLGSDQGVFRVAKAALTANAQDRTKLVPCIVYGRSDGLPSLECSSGYQPAAWRGQDGRLWFTTLKGAVSVQPADLRANALPPPVVIEDVLLDGKSLAAAADSGSNTENPAALNLNHEQRLDIQPGRHQVEFQYTGISLVASERVKFRYQLEGEDPGWIEAGNRRSVQYSYLPPGEYRFHVIACNSDGIWNNTGDSLRLKVWPHFYETWWFRVAVGFVVMVVISGVIRHTATLRLRRIMEQLERQHVLERERTRIAKDIHDDLGASLTLIAVLGDLAKKEKTGDRIEKMSGMAREAVKSLDEIVWAVNPRNDTLAHLVDYAGQFATDYLRDAGIRCLLDVPEQTPAREVPANVRHNLFLVVKEALQNIVKHARATEVWLRISATAEHLKIVVEDNGCGFENPPENALADGLRNMRQRLGEIDARCQVQSRPGAGTAVIIELSWPTP